MDKKGNRWTKPWFGTDIILNRQFQKFLTTDEKHHPDVLKSVSACWGIIFQCRWSRSKASYRNNNNTVQRTDGKSNSNQRERFGGSQWEFMTSCKIWTQNTRIIALMSGSNGNHSVRLSNETDVSLDAVCHGVLVFAPWGTLGGWSCSFNCKSIGEKEPSSHSVCLRLGRWRELVWHHSDRPITTHSGCFPKMSARKVVEF